LETAAFAFMRDPPTYSTTKGRGLTEGAGSGCRIAGSVERSETPVNTVTSIHSLVGFASLY